MNSMTTLPPTDDEIRQAAEALVARYGRSAVEVVTHRAESFCGEGRWPEHSTALRMLTVVESLLREGI